ncbi:hypothetical protein PF003_g7981 [Phytophthora fragariae]|nr:hypothetical protein PF003_g7981 [Phytophthora fragariae]
MRSRVNDLDGDLLTYAIDTFDTPRVVIPRMTTFVLVWCTSTMMHPLVVTSGARRRSQHSRVTSSGHACTSGYGNGSVPARSASRVKPAASKQAPLRSATPSPRARGDLSAWTSSSGLPRDAKGRTGVLVFVDRFSKMVHLAPVAAEVTADESAELFLDLVFRHHGLPESIVSDRDPRFTSAFWTRLFALLGTRLLMSTAAHPETDGQTERVNRVLEDVLRSYATSFAS